MRVEDDFDIEGLLHDDLVWAHFLNEIFHHALRITPEVAPEPLSRRCTAPV